MTQISGLSSVWDGWDFSYLLSILLGVIPSLICITLHELSHGYVAYRLGDDTAKQAGRLTLNPIRHLDPVGLLMMLVFRVGWAKPVPVNMYRFKNPKRGMAITALAGPVSNVLITLVFLLLEALAAMLVLTCNDYHRASYVSSANVITGSVFRLTSSIGRYFGLAKANEALVSKNLALQEEVALLRAQLDAVPDSVIDALPLSASKLSLYFFAAIVVWP